MLKAFHKLFDNPLTINLSSSYVGSVRAATEGDGGLLGRRSRENH